MVRCDSLSNLYLWHIKYSSFCFLYVQRSVVIRFQICIFDILNTAYGCQVLLKGKVVIRFQICIFDILNTAGLRMGYRVCCCDSLSNLYLWHIKYSQRRLNRFSKSVVIRFQICIFDILNTAVYTSGGLNHMLWFAFKFVSLTY